MAYSRAVLPCCYKEERGVGGGEKEEDGKDSREEDAERYSLKMRDAHEDDADLHVYIQDGWLDSMARCLARGGGGAARNFENGRFPGNALSRVAPEAAFHEGGAAAAAGRRRGLGDLRRGRLVVVLLLLLAVSLAGNCGLVYYVLLGS